MKVKNKILTLIIMIFAICMILIPNNVNAALQANGAAPAISSVAGWITSIRQMEATGGTLGLTDTIDTTSLVSSAEKSNNLDIHMEKNTEYGAMAILSASSYGNQNVIASGGTTTGNKTGVYMNLNREWVAAGSLTGVSAFVNANPKYKNVYTKDYVAKVGDAISETKGWHGSNSSQNLQWINDEAISGLIRAHYNSIFSYNGYALSYVSSADVTSTRKSYSTRAVIVVGNGF